MADKQIKVSKEKFNWWNDRFDYMYNEMGNRPVIDKVFAKYKDIDETLYDKWCKAFKQLLTNVNKDKDYFEFDKNQFQDLINIVLSFQQAFKDTLDINNVDDGVMLKEGWANVVDFTNQYVNYLKQCLAGKEANKKETK